MSFEAITAGAVLSALPVSELRGGIPLMRAMGLNLYTAFAVGVAANILVIPLMFLFLDNLNGLFMKNKTYRGFFERHVEKTRCKYSGKFKGWPYLGLWAFVAVPFPMTGVYTGTLIAWLFGFEKKKSFIAIALGAVAAGVIVSLAVAGIIKIF